MRFDDIALDNLAGTNTAVVGTLRGGVAWMLLVDVHGVNGLMERHTVLRPAVGAIVQIEEGVFLLKTEPRLVLGVKLHELGALVTVVVLVRGAISIPAFGEDEDVCVRLATTCSKDVR